MSLYDKFGIIENHLAHEDNKMVVSKIENYFENLLNSDIRVLIPDYINQVIWFEGINSDDFTIKVDVHIKNYLIQRRNNMRTFIKKESFEFSSLNKFLKNFIVKLEYLNTMLKSQENKIVKEGIRQLTNLIISDSLIMLFVEEQVILFDKSLKTEIETLLKLTKTLGKYDSNETFIKMLKTIGNVFKKYLINMEEFPLPENIKRIQKLSDNIKFCKNVKAYYKFVGEEFKVFALPLIQLIVDNLTDVIQHNTLEEVEFTFENIWLDFSKIVLDNQFDGKNDLISNLSKEIVCLINKVLKQSGESNVFKLINILKYVDQLVEKQDCRDIINQKIALSLSSEELLEEIHSTIDNLLSENKSIEALKLLKFVSNVKDKDVFINKYYQFLIKRLMNTISRFEIKKENTDSNKFLTYIQSEKNMLDFLKLKFGDKQCYRINKVIMDTELSYDDNINFEKLTAGTFDNKMTVITTSYSNWDVNQSEGIVTNSIVESIKQTQLGKHLRNYLHYYELRYSNKRIINWFPHFGEVSITYLNQNFVMLPIQFMIMEMFNDKDRVPVNQIQSEKFFSNYTLKFRSDIIGSLVVSGLFKIQGDNMILMSSGNFKSNLIEVFFTSSDYSSMWEQQRREELVHSREEVTNAVINSVIKTNTNANGLTPDELFKMCKSQIQVFELDRMVFDKSVEYMCKQDYIKREDSGSYVKLVY
jgi:hypothetical protein